jgi:hypothetical protein
MPEALAEKILRKINLLCCGYLAYRAYIDGTNAVNLQHLSNPNGYAAGLPLAERKLLAALLTYTSTSDLPQQVLSAGDAGAWLA